MAPRGVNQAGSRRARYRGSADPAGSKIPPTHKATDGKPPPVISI